VNRIFTLALYNNTTLSGAGLACAAPDEGQSIGRYNKWYSRPACCPEKTCAAPTKRGAAGVFRRKIQLRRPSRVRYRARRLCNIMENNNIRIAHAAARTVISRESNNVLVVAKIRRFYCYSCCCYYYMYYCFILSPWVTRFDFPIGSENLFVIEMLHES